MHRAISLMSVVALSLLIYGGGPPNKGTPKDQRLKANNPNAGKKPAAPKPPTQQKGMKGGKNC